MTLNTTRANPYQQRTDRHKIGDLGQVDLIAMSPTCLVHVTLYKCTSQLFGLVRRSGFEAAP